MFNSVNNPFGNRRVESSTSSDKNGGQQHQQERKEPEKNLFDENEQDEVKFGQQPVMTEDDIVYMVKEYINRLKDEHGGDEKFTQKADKWLEKFDVIPVFNDYYFLSLFVIMNYTSLLLK